MFKGKHVIPAIHVFRLFICKGYMTPTLSQGHPCFQNCYPDEKKKNNLVQTKQFQLVLPLILTIGSNEILKINILLSRTYLQVQSIDWIIYAVYQSSFDNAGNVSTWTLQLVHFSVNLSHSKLELRFCRLVLQILSWRYTSSAWTTQSWRPLW